ncbi:UNVERIFIED_CONTAM: hypothetical protein K2H54_040407 [Gekko kuhli]
MTFHSTANDFLDDGPKCSRRRHMIRRKMNQSGPGNYQTPFLPIINLHEEFHWEFLSPRHLPNRTSVCQQAEIQASEAFPAVRLLKLKYSDGV